MATKKKMLQAAAGQAGGAGGAALDITDVFSTSLYEGTGSAQTITNGIDFDGEGGMIWGKSRSNGNYYAIVDTARGGTEALITNLDYAARTGRNYVSSFNSNGYTTGNEGDFSGTSGLSMVNWAFRKAPKFFDVVTWTGNGTYNRAIPHNLGGEVGSYFVKCTSHSTASDWIVWHKELSSNSDNLVLNTTATVDNYNLFSTTAPDSSNVYLGAANLDYFNATGRTYVAYVFAHNSGDGEFGPDGDQDIIKCGIVSGFGTTVDIGWEPQWLLVKRINGTGEWVLVDNMRGIATGGGDAVLYAHAPDAETSANNWIDLTSTGFTNLIGSGNYIYIAIRRGPLAPPQSATEVFDVQTFAGNVSANRKINTGFVVDANITWGLDGKPACLAPRLYDGMHEMSSAGTPYNSLPEWIDGDYNDGFTYPTPYSLNNNNGVTYVSYSWKRAPGYFDVVAYSGDGTGDRKLLHNLGVTPEMVWLKPRSTGDSYSGNWFMWHNTFGHSQTGAHLHLNTNDSLSSGTGANPVHSFDADGISPNIRGGGAGEHNKTGVDYILYLFASLPGISKVGSFSHATGTPTDVDCGFTAGARFVLWKKTSNTDGWQVYDTTRGITSGNDPFLQLNSTAAEITNEDLIDPLSTGFTVSANKNSGDYIFYAVA